MNKSLTDKTYQESPRTVYDHIRQINLNSFKRLNDNSPERKYIIFTRRVAAIRGAGIK